ncbi:peptide deformylase [Candidatus Saccharibacteria bacterium]|nr:peptide deformylase [Candidatus Saccharibacteria bacterium]
MIRPIVTIENPRIRMQSKPVDVVDQSIHAIVQDMIDTALDWESDRKGETAVALAAIQINVPLRILIIRKDFEQPSNKDFSVIINPIISEESPSTLHQHEGCLSVPDRYAKLDRPKSLVVTGTSLEGKRIKKRLRGFSARIIRHEVDHMDGKLFVDYLNDTDKKYRIVDGELQDD